MPLRSVDRPLTLLEDHFGLFPAALGTPYQNKGLVGLFFGAGYGIDDDFEIGLTLLRVTMSPAPDTGLDAPTGYVKYRLLDGPLEIAGLAEIELPLDDFTEFRAAIPMRLHLPMVRLDLEPGVFGGIANPIAVGVEVPAELRVQLGDRFALIGYAGVSWPSLRVSRAALFQAGGGVGLTIARHNAALAEIRASGFGPSVVIGDDAALTAPIGSDWGVFVDATIYLRSDPSDAAPESLF